MCTWLPGSPLLFQALDHSSSEIIIIVTVLPLIYFLKKQNNNNNHHYPNHFPDFSVLELRLRGDSIVDSSLPKV